MVNWTINCPKHVEDLKLFYPKHMLNPNGSFLSSISEMVDNNTANNPG